MKSDSRAIAIALVSVVRTGSGVESRDLYHLQDTIGDTAYQSRTGSIRLSEKKISKCMILYVGCRSVILVLDPTPKKLTH